MKKPKQQQLSTPSTESGFTLIECLLAIIIVAVLLAAVAPAIVLSAATRLQARRVEQATQAARAYVDGLRAGSIPPPPNAKFVTYQGASVLFGGSTAAGANEFPAPKGASGWTCTLAPLTAGTTPTASNFYCKDAGNLWDLYCVDLDGGGCGKDGSGVKTSHKDFLIQSYRSVTVPQNYTGNYVQLAQNAADEKQGYVVAIRVYRADGFNGIALRTSVDEKDPQKRAKRQLGYTAGVGDRTTPLVELTTEIAPKAGTGYQNLKDRLGTGN